MTVYGERYEASRKTAPSPGAYFAGASATVTLGNSCPEGLVGQEFTYVSAVGEPRTRYCEARHDGSKQTVAFDDAGGDISYRCVYRPSEITGDLFYSPAATIANYARVDSPEQTPVVEGYRGIWFSIGQAASEYGPKYSGGLGTYTMKHIPMAVYARPSDGPISSTAAPRTRAGNTCNV